MFSLLGFHAVLAVPRALAAGAGGLHALTSSWVRAQEAKRREAAGLGTGVAPVTLELVVDESQLQRILQSRDVQAGGALCAALKERGMLATCTSCGSVAQQ